MAVIEDEDITVTLKKYPYYAEWLQELGRLPEDVKQLFIAGEVQEVESDTPWKKFEPTDNCIVSMVFKDGSVVERTEKWSEGKMRYEPATPESEQGA